MGFCYLNGRVLPIEEAKVSPLDRGFLFGDGAYELIPVYSRRPFRLEQHLSRLQRTLDEIRLPNPLSVSAWATALAELVAAAPYDDQSVYLHVTRGVDVGRSHAFPSCVAPTVFMMTAPLVSPDAAVRQRGVACITAPDIRWQRCDLKVISLLPNVLLRQRALDAGCAESILLRDGFLTEGSASSVFVCRGGMLLAPVKDQRVLPGVTYDVVISLAEAHGVPLEVRDIRETELRGADEIWLTSSTSEVLPVTTLDGMPVGQGEASGRPGPMAVAMQGWYEIFRDTVMRSKDG